MSCVTLPSKNSPTDRECRLSAKWRRVQAWDRENLTGPLTPVRYVLHALSSITLAAILLVGVALYAVLASVPVGLLALIPTWIVYILSLVLVSDVLGHVAHPLLSLPFESSCLPSPVADLAAPPLLHSFRAKFGHERDERTVALSHLRVEQGRVLGPFCSVDVVTVAPCFKGFLDLAVVVRRGVEGWAARVRALWARLVRAVLFRVRGVRSACWAVLFSAALGGRCWRARWRPSVLPIFACGLRTRFVTRRPIIIRPWGPGLVRW